MFLAIRELAFKRGRFVIMGAVIALIAILTVLLSGLSVGLRKDGVSGLESMDVTTYAFQENVSEGSAFSRSVVNIDAVDVWKQQPGVAEAAPFGNTLVNGRSSHGVEVDLALFGIEQGSFIEPDVAEGSPVTSKGQVVISPTAADEGIGIGDVITLDPAGIDLEVVGILSGQHTFGHVDVGYISLETWQEVSAGVRPGDSVPAHVYQDITAVAVKSDGSGEFDMAAGDAAAGTTSIRKVDSYDASPGYSAETATLDLIQMFLYGISALVVGAFFTVLTIQRQPEIAVMRAMGAGTGYLVRDGLAQSLILLLISGGVGVASGLAAGLAITSTPMPFAIEYGQVFLAMTLLLVLGLIGAVVAIVRITRVDPLTALGGSR